MENKLKVWAVKVVNAYNPMGIYFYTQSNLLQLHQHPEVLIPGINPGSEGSLLKAYRTPEEFLQGNPYFSKDVKWRLSHQQQIHARKESLACQSVRRIIPG